MMGLLRRKPSAAEGLNGKAQGSSPPPSNDELLQQRKRNPAPLPDLRLSGFDIDKMMGAAGLNGRSSPSPLVTTDDEDLPAGVQRDYITTKGGSSASRSAAHTVSVRVQDEFVG